MWDYSEKVKQHFFNPNNAKVVENANAKGDVGSISCGDALSLTLKVDPDTDTILDAGFQTFGCGSAIASSSALTTLIIGKTLDEAKCITNQDIANYLDGLPPEKMHCSVMGMEALEAAIADYRGEVLGEHHEEGELICKCFAIDDVLIRKVVADNHLTSLEEVINYTKAGGGCSSCHEKIELVLEECLAASGTRKGKAKAPVAAQSMDVTSLPISGASTEQFEQELSIINDVIESARPAIQADGGDIELVDFENDMLFVTLRGACTGCGLAGMTVHGIETKVSMKLKRSITVFPVQVEDKTQQEGAYHV